MLLKLKYAFLKTCHEADTCVKLNHSLIIDLPFIVTFWSRLSEIFISFYFIIQIIYIFFMPKNTK